MLPFAYRVNVSATFPAQVVGTEGVEVSKANGIYTIGSAYETLAALGSIPIPDEKMVKIWDRITGIYNSMPLSIIVDSGGGGGGGSFSYNIVPVTVGNYLVSPVDDLVIVAKSVGSATTVTMPASALRTRGPVQIKDGKGDADTNNITVLFNGTEKADNFTSIIIRSKYGSVAFAPNPAGGWVVLLYG
jgi:hypothetical protein